MKGIFVGYDTDSPGFRVFINECGDVVSSSNVVFDEKGGIESFVELEMPLTDKNVEMLEIEKLSDENSEYDERESQSDSSESQIEEPHCEMPIKRNLRDRSKLKAPARYEDFEIDSGLMVREIEADVIGEVSDISVAEALKNENWKKAMNDEYKSLIEMQTWILTQKPKDVEPLTCRWVLCKKENGRYKARLVVRGFEQKEGRDYFEIFSPVARHMFDLYLVQYNTCTYYNIRFILSIAASQNMNVMTFDVKTAFLHGELDEQIFMYQPEGFNDMSGRVCKLKKSLYGLKQAPKNWNKKFTNFLNYLHFEDTDDDPCVYYNEDRSIIIVLHVDDGLMVGKSKIKMLEVLKKLDEKFKITYDTGEKKFFVVSWNAD